MNLFTFGIVKKNIVTLAIANMIIGFIEFCFNIYLSRELGAEGLGLLALVSPINCLFLSFMTEGLVVTISKMSAKHLHFGDYNAMDRTIRISTLFSFLWSAVLCALVCLTADSIASGFLGDSSLSSAILATCPLMMLMSISNIVKGHFLGIGRIALPAAINITEKLLRFPILYFLIYYLYSGCSSNAVCLPVQLSPVAIVYICYALGEVHSVVWLLLYYRWTRVRAEKKSCISARAILTGLIAGATPICLTQCSLEFFNALSSVIVQSRLCSAGLDSSDALALLGKYKGMVFPLVNYPMILVGAVCAVVVPKISTFIAAGKPAAASRLIKRSLTMAIITGAITCFLFCIWADGMGTFFYKRDDLGFLIRCAGLMAPLIYTAATTNSLLIGMGFEAVSFRNILLQQIILLIGLIVFTGMPAVNIYGYPLAVTFSNAILLVQNIYVLKNMKPSHKIHKRVVY